MLFHSLPFIFLFLLFLSGFCIFKNEARLVYVTLFSYFFYAWWHPPYLILLVGFTLFAHYVVLANLSPTLFKVAIALSLTPLCLFKYTAFFIRNLNSLLGLSIPLETNWALPLGISFITFTVIAYLVDTRRGVYPAQTSITRTALYLSFFPHLIAGPIMRPKELLPQLNHLRIKPALAKLGFFLFSVGMVKKIVFADQIAIWVDRWYPVDAALNLPRSLFLFYAFPVQIYCDFSGYTDMALGLAFILGVRLPLNFNRPYVSTSIREFWRRWHITLSRWLRDYLYIPLGGNRYGMGRTFFTLLITMLLGGFWHGAAWTFVLWGAYHGALLVFERLLGRGKALNKPSLIRTLFAFHLVAIGWILFRAHGWSEVRHMVGGFFVPGDWKDSFVTVGFQVGLIGLFFLVHKWDRISMVVWFVRRFRKGAFLYALAIILIILSKILSIGNPSAFIYFDF